MSEFKAITTQEEFDSMVKERLDRQAKKTADEVKKTFDGWLSPDDVKAKTAELVAQTESLREKLAEKDSKLAELKAPGKVDPRDIGDGADWGNMNDKEREQALQDVGREFPSHYREVIEEYFRRLAAEESAEQP